MNIRQIFHDGKQIKLSFKTSVREPECKIPDIRYLLSAELAIPH